MIKLRKKQKIKRLSKTPIHFFLLLFLFLPHAFAAEDYMKPLWEVGLVGAYARLPHYRGSDEHNHYYLPVPYLIYRGELFKVDRDSITGIFFKTDRWETSVSVFGNPPVDGDNEARRGMSDLDAVFEVGPSLKYFLFEREHPDELFLRGAIRGVSSVGFDDGIDFVYRGLHAETNIIYRNNSLLKKYRMAFGMNYGIEFTDDRFNGYFYDVPAEHALPDRPAYDADNGYAGMAFSTSISKKLTDYLTLGGYFKWDNISGAVFDDSPLVKRKNNYIFGAAIIWRIFKSEEKVKAK